MKKLILITAVILMTGITFGQTLQKGTLIGFHSGSFLPNPDVTMNQCISFLKDKFLPEYEKNVTGSKCYLLKSKRGECIDCLSFIIIFPSDAVRNKYWNADNTMTELGKIAFEKMKSVLTEMNKFGKMTDKFTDWIIQ